MTDEAAAPRPAPPPSLILSRRDAMLAIGASTLPLQAAAQARIAATDPRLAYEGRTQETAPGIVTLGFPGIVLRFAAAGDAALLCRATDANSFLDIHVEGEAPRTLRLDQGAQRIPLATGPELRHIDIVKRSAAWDGSVIDILGIEAARLEPAPPPPPRRLSFIGDSITCGSNADWPDLSAPEGPEHESASQSYAAELARRLGAQRHLIAYGGRGVLRDWRGHTDTNNAPQFYPRALPDDPASRWDARTYVPQAVGICLGTNDFNTGIPDESDFIAAYLALIATVRADAPRAPIIVISSPMLVDSPDVPRRTVHRAYLDMIVARAASPLVRRADIAHEPGRPGHDAHPIAPQHQHIADQLEPLFRAALAEG